MSKECDFAGAGVDEGFYFFDDFSGGTGVFGAADFGDDAVGATAVATKQNSDKGGDVWREVLAGIFGNVGGRIEVGDTGFASAKALQELGNVGGGAGAESEVEERDAFEEFGAEALRHATSKADEHGAFSFFNAEEARLANGLVFGLAAHGASVDEDEVGVVLALRGGEAVGFEERGEHF